jgi:hypothetical protein
MMVVVARQSVGNRRVWQQAKPQHAPFPFGNLRPECRHSVRPLRSLGHIPTEVPSVDPKVLRDARVGQPIDTLCKRRLHVFDSCLDVSRQLQPKGLPAPHRAARKDAH